MSDEPTSLKAWLGALKCGELLGPLTDEYGAESVSDLADLEPEDIAKLQASLKKIAANRFGKAVAALSARAG